MPLPNLSSYPYKDGMDVYDDLSAVPAAAKGHIIAIGNFDGVHLGHRALLEHAKQLARYEGRLCGVLTFEPHPRKLFRPDEPPFRITPPLLKQRMLEGLGVDFVVTLNFDWDFASQSAENFVQKALIDILSPAHVVIGEDFRFGQLRKGNTKTISDAGIPVTTFSPVGSHEISKYSSTDIRNYIAAGEIKSANDILGWEWEIGGVIVRGDRRGHDLGYPTANVSMGDVLHPAYGVYATWVQIDGENEWRMAATNIGIRPMFEVAQGQIEAHILDFADSDIYSRYLRVRPVKRLRGEAKFASIDDLIAQMAKDCAQAKMVLLA